jgi:hypothetical protein
MKTLLVALLTICFLQPAFAQRNAVKDKDDDIGITYDLGISTGKDTNDLTYTEANIGINLQKDWLAWRNALFGRFATAQENIYGIDSSIRGILEDQTDEAFGYHFFVGPGYRFVTRGTNLPFAEAGLIMRLGGISLGGGAKAFFNELVDKNQKNETQYTIILGGGGRL